MSKTERRIQRDKLKRVYQPPSSRRQQYKDEIEEGLEEWDGIQTSGKAMQRTYPMGTITHQDGKETSQGS